MAAQAYGHLPIDVAFGDLLVPSKSLDGLINAVQETRGHHRRVGVSGAATAQS